MGAVYRARRLLLGDEVAIKVMRAEFAVDPSSKERFFRESRACAQLRHPNIVSILDFNVDADGRPFLVMELLNGRSLRQEIAARGALPLTEAIATITPLSAALQLAHDRGILHRDLKPANIVLHDFGGGTRVHKIVDFGLAQIREASDATRLTSAHQFLGTIPYASPEQLTGGRVDGRADIYSLGVVVYELLTGRVPFPGTDAMAVVTALLTTAPPSPSSLRSDLPAWVDVVLARALAKEPADRYESMTAFGRALAARNEAERPTMSLDTAGTSGGLLATYDVGRKLGAGRLGSEVFLGTHRALGHPVAIRLLRRGSERNWNAVRARFLREAKTLQIAHPSIHPGPRLRRGRGPGLSRYRLHRGLEPARSADGRRRDAVGAAAAVARADDGSGAGAPPAQRPVVRRQSRHHAGHARRRRRAADDLDRGHLAGAGSPGDACATRRCAGPRWQTSSSTTLRLSC